jgi:hypothetical protein
MSKGFSADGYTGMMGVRLSISTSSVVLVMAVVPASRAGQEDRALCVMWSSVDGGALARERQSSQNWGPRFGRHVGGGYLRPNEKMTVKSR